MRTLLLADDGQVESTALLCAAAETGIEIQAFYDPGLSQRDPGAVVKHAAAVDKIGLRSLHGPFGDLCPGSFDPMVREVARDRFELAYRYAQELGAADIVVHLGYVPGTSHPQRWLARCTDFWKEYLADKSSAVRFHVENMLERDPELLLDVVAAIDRPNVDVCLDIGHAHCRSAMGVLRWIERLGSGIGYVHLHDNHGIDDEHLGLGQGTIPLDEVCRALDEHAPQALWTLETQPEWLESSLAWLGQRGLSSRSR